MPELPEVESIRIKLEKYLIGHKVEKVKVNYAKALQGDPKKLTGGKVEKIRRFGKVLSIDLDNGYSAVIHIKLTGQLIYRGPNLKNPPSLSKKVVGGVPGLPAKASKMRAGKHTHVVFELDKGGVLLDDKSQRAALYYNDVRKFGWIKIVKTGQVQEIDFIKKLGPEPLDGLTFKKFKEILGSTRRSIKTLLMDQSKIGGVGNIYANDALWKAKIHPERPADKLKEDEIKKLYKAIEEVLKAGLKYEGASELAFVMPDGEEGSYQDHSLVYGREGESCRRHKDTKVKKKKVAGRGTYYCPACQRL